MSEEGNEDDEEAELNALSNQLQDPADGPSGSGGATTSGFNTIPANYDGKSPIFVSFILLNRFYLSISNLSASTLPSPPVDPEIRNPGGFQPYAGPTDPTLPAVYQPPQPLASSANLTPDQLIKAQKYCKWAGSALTYEDVKSAIENLQKGLHLLQFGKEL